MTGAVGSACAGTVVIVVGGTTESCLSLSSFASLIPNGHEQKVLDTTFIPVPTHDLQFVRSPICR